MAIDEATLLAAIETTAHLLPDQGPLHVFVHHNTLHAFQHLPFDEAIARAAETYGANRYWTKSAYLSVYASGRITNADLRAALVDRLGEKRIQQLVEHGLFDLATALLCLDFAELSDAELWFAIEEGSWGQRLRESVTAEMRRKLLGAERDRAREARVLRELWSVACEAAACIGHATTATPTRRPRDTLLHAIGMDSDDHVRPHVIRWAAAYLDGGQAYVPMPGRERGFYAAWRAIVLQTQGLASPYWVRVCSIVQNQARHGLDATGAALEIVNAWHDRGFAMPSAVEAVLLALPGWSGMFHRLQSRPRERVAHVPVELVDYLAVWLVLEEAAVQYLSENGNVAQVADGIRASQRPTDEARPDLFEAYRLFLGCQHAGIDANRLRHTMGLKHDREANVSVLQQLLHDFAPSHVLDVWQCALEQAYRRELVDALSSQRDASALHSATAMVRPRAQLITCIDDREESLRRHVEEIAPQIETFGAAGFFGLAMQYQSLADPTPVALCPVGVQPSHIVCEDAHPDDAKPSPWRAHLQRLGARVLHEQQWGSRGLARGLLVTGALGWLAFAPLVLRLVSPTRAGRVQRWLSRLLLPHPRSVLRVQAEDVDNTSELREGMTLSDQVERVYALLASIGMTKSFGPIVVVLGHGATSLNNPHLSAYQCGACGGRPGGPNARLFARLANRAIVRRKLRERGLTIPDDTVFVGGLHDTTRDVVTYFDLQDVPSTHIASLGDVQNVLNHACQRNALERLRFFENASAVTSPAAALAHVQRRAEALDEPRPEYNHALNASCIVGRRALTRGLYLDQRTFLVSYDMRTDPSDNILERTLLAITPVCAGINLEYYFSTIDAERYGSGTKLQHNLTGLLGVMSGQCSDLRTGLAEQMTEIHEPVRLLMVVETDPTRLESILARQPALQEWVYNQWVHLCTIDSETRDIRMWRAGRWMTVKASSETVPIVPSSLAYCVTRKGPLSPVRIRNDQSYERHS
jgi:uncharacterized protein YbcC (UPF0753/DUF2309 family)